MSTPPVAPHQVRRIAPRDEQVVDKQAVNRSRLRAGSGVDAGLLPPRCLIRHAVYQSMVNSTERDRQLVAGLATQCPRLQDDVGRTVCDRRACGVVGRNNEGAPCDDNVGGGIASLLLSMPSG